MQNKYKKILAFILMVLWMGVIFSFSAKVATQSSAQSTGVVEVIKGILEKIFPNTKSIDIEKWEVFETILRKFAHGFIFFILGILSSNFIIRCNFKHKIIISGTICLLYAISDEIHQLFVEGRSGQISDVLVDFTGSIVGICLFFVVINCLHNRSKV